MSAGVTKSGLAGLLLSGCVLMSGCGSDPEVYDLPLAEAKAKIAGTRASYKIKSDTRWMRSAGPAPGGLRIKLSDAGVFSASCVLKFEEVDAQSTRITPDCGKTGAATTDALAEFSELEIAALVRQTLTGEPVDADRLASAMVDVMKQNVAQMSAEGFEPDEQWVQEQKEKAIQRKQDEQAGWAE